MTGNKAAKKTSRGNENPPSPTTRGKNQDGVIVGLLHENVRNAISSLLQNDADIMKAIVAAVTEAVLSELTGNTVFVSNMVEAITKCGPILDRVKQDVFESVSIDVAQTTGQTTDAARELERRVAHLERDNASLHVENDAQEQYSRRNCLLLHGVPEAQTDTDDPARYHREPDEAAIGPTPEGTVSRRRGCNLDHRRPNCLPCGQREKGNRGDRAGLG